MFDDYLSDVDTYLALENFFYDFFIGIVKDNKPVECPYYNVRFSNGKPFMDGNPIFSARKGIGGEVIKVVLDEDADSLSDFINKVEGVDVYVVVANICFLEEIKEKITIWYEK